MHLNLVSRSSRWVTSMMLMLLVSSAIPLHAGYDDSLPVANTESAKPQEEKIVMPQTDENSLIYRGIKYAGKFHLLALHFPIAFLLMAMLAQWHGVVTGRNGNLTASLLWFGALGSLLAATLGWMYAYDSVYFGDDEKILFWHRWLGTGTALLAVLVLFLRKHLGAKSLGVLLSLCAALVAAAAHFGASLVHGADFLKKF